MTCSSGKSSTLGDGIAEACLDATAAAATASAAAAHPGRLPAAPPANAEAKTVAATPAATAATSSTGPPIDGINAEVEVKIVWDTPRHTTITLQCNNQKGTMRIWVVVHACVTACVRAWHSMVWWHLFFWGVLVAWGCCFVCS